MTDPAQQAYPPTDNAERVMEYAGPSARVPTKTRWSPLAFCIGLLGPALVVAMCSEKFGLAPLHWWAVGMGIQNASAKFSAIGVFIFVVVAMCTQWKSQRWGFMLGFAIAAGICSTVFGCLTVLGGPCRVNLGPGPSFQRQTVVG